MEEFKGKLIPYFTKENWCETNFEHI